MEGQKSQPMGIKASEGKPEGKPAIGPKRGTAVRPRSQFTQIADACRLIAWWPCWPPWPKLRDSHLFVLQP